MLHIENPWRKMHSVDNNNGKCTPRTPGSFLGVGKIEFVERCTDGHIFRRYRKTQIDGFVPHSHWIPPFSVLLGYHAQWDKNAPSGGVSLWQDVKYISARKEIYI